MGYKMLITEHIYSKSIDWFINENIIMMEIKNITNSALFFLYK